MTNPNLTQAELPSVIDLQGPVDLHGGAPGSASAEFDNLDAVSVRSDDSLFADLRATGDLPGVCNVASRDCRFFFLNKRIGGPARWPAQCVHRCVACIDLNGCKTAVILYCFGGFGGTQTR
jgi:hypothetical protein